MGTARACPSKRKWFAWTTLGLALALSATGCAAQGGGARSGGPTGSSGSTAGSVRPTPMSAAHSTSGARRGPTARKEATTPVPPPVRGNIHQIVKARRVITKPPVSLHAVANFGTGVTARITSIRAVETHAVGPGEVSGPGLRLVIQLANGTDKSIRLDNAVVTIADAAGTPGVPMTFAPQVSDSEAKGANNPQQFPHPMTGSLGAHKKASGSYIFTIPAGHRNPVTVNFSYAGGGPVVLFRGNAQ